MNNNKIISFNKKKIPLELAKKGSSTFVDKDSQQYVAYNSKNGGVIIIKTEADNKGGDV